MSDRERRGPHAALREIQRAIAACRDCPNMAGTPVHGPAMASPVFLLGQAPGPHEAGKGRPFAHTAGRTLFKWFQEAAGIDEATFRERVYMAAVARCFPGKAKGGADRVPDADEIARCRRHLEREVAILKPRLVLAVGKLAIAQALGPERFGPAARLTDVVGKTFEVDFHGVKCDVICLPHPSGVSSWPRVEPGRTLLARALKLVHKHPAWEDHLGAGACER